jgi:glutathione reductase (NADPH)
LEEFDYDLFVIGGGSGGVRASRIAATLGARVAVAEERYMGGTCVNVGCVPKKLFSYAAHYSHDFSDSQGFGWELAQPPSFNWDTLRAAKDREIARLNGIYLGMLRQAGVTVYETRAELIDAHTIRAGAETFRARHILIATGGWPFVPEFEGSNLAITSNEMFTLEKFPASILVVGAGYIAVEFAGICAGLGARTTLAHRGAGLLRGFDQEVAELLCGELRKYSDLKLESTVVSIQRESADILCVRFRNGEELGVEAVLFATGRQPNSAGMGLEEAGIKLASNGAIIVDDNFRTSIPHIYAVGDVIDRVALTPVALAEGQILAHHLFGKANHSMSYENIPTAIFSHPNIGTVGLTEEQARATGAEISVFKSRFTPLRHTLSGNSEKTFLKMLVDARTDRVLGIHMLGPDAGEIIQGMAVAMKAGATKTHFDSTLGIHPTTAEEFVTMRTPEPRKP